MGLNTPKFVIHVNTFDFGTLGAQNFKRRILRFLALPNILLDSSLNLLEFFPELPWPFSTIEEICQNALETTHKLSSIATNDLEC